jgi:hypothetical protein
LKKCLFFQSLKPNFLVKQPSKLLSNYGNFEMKKPEGFYNLGGKHPK